MTLTAHTESAEMTAQEESKYGAHEINKDESVRDLVRESVAGLPRWGDVPAAPATCPAATAISNVESCGQVRVIEAAIGSSPSFSSNLSVGESYANAYQTHIASVEAEARLRALELD